MNIVAITYTKVHILNYYLIENNCLTIVQYALYYAEIFFLKLILLLLEVSCEHFID